MKVFLSWSGAVSSQVRKPGVLRLAGHAADPRIRLRNLRDRQNLCISLEP